MTRRVVRHAHRKPRRWVAALDAASLIVILAVLVVVLPLLWKP